MSTRIRSLGVQPFNVKSYGAVGDGSTNDTSAFAAAITAASNEIATYSSSIIVATIIIPPGRYRLANLVVPKGIRLIGNGALLLPVAGTTGPMLTFNGGYGGIRDVYLAGSAITGASAITVASGAFHIEIDNCRFDNWDGRAIYDQGIATRIVHAFAQNCLLGANDLTTYTGVVELANTDAWLSDSELTASRYSARGASTNKYACALAVTGANNMIRDVVAETSDHGVYVGSGATQTAFDNVRGELNYGHGWFINGGGGRMVNCMALRNSKAGSLQFNGFHVPGTNASAFVATNCVSDCSSATEKHNYGIFDASTSRSTWNRWVNPMSINDNIGFFNANSTNVGFLFPPNPPQNMDVGASPSAPGLTYLLANNSSATTVTSFGGIVNGQRLFIKGDGNTTFSHNANISMLSGANTLLAAGTWYEFLRISAVLTQVR